MMKWNNQTIVRTLHSQFLGYNEDYYGAFTLDVKSMLIEILGGILGVTPLLNGQQFNVKWMLV
jgi:hypothetical protein